MPIRPVTVVEVDTTLWRIEFCSWLVIFFGGSPGRDGSRPMILPPGVVLVGCPRFSFSFTLSRTKTVATDMFFFTASKVLRRNSLLFSRRRKGRLAATLYLLSLYLQELIQGRWEQGQDLILDTTVLYRVLYLYVDAEVEVPDVRYVSLLSTSHEAIRASGSLSATLRSCHLSQSGGEATLTV